MPLAPEKRRSALEAFSECQFRWEQLYVAGVKDESDEAKRGTCFHACMKFYVRALFEARTSQDLELAREAFHAGLVEAPAPAHLFDEIYHLFWNFAERFELDVDAYLLNEVRPDDPDDYKLQIDLAYAKGDVLELPDFKTHYNIWSERRARQAFQPKFYLARARRIWPGFTTYRFVFVFVRFGVEVPVEYSADALDRVDDQVLAIEAAQAEALARGTFPATPGDHCGYCSLPCPVVDQALTNPVRLLTKADAERTAGEYVAMLQAIGARRKALESFCTLNGDVDIDGVSFGHRPTSSTKYPAAAVIDALRKSDIEPTFQIGTTAVKSYTTAKKYAHVRDAITALAVVKPGSKFTVSRSTTVTDDDEAEE